MTVTLPDNFLDFFEGKMSPDTELGIRLAAQFYASGEVSVGKAAELSGLRRWEFEQWLHSHDVSIPWSKEDLEQELASLKSQQKSAS